MFKEINTWQDLQDEIKALFSKSPFIDNPDKVYKDISNIVDEVKKKQVLFLKSPQALNEYLFKTYPETLNYWLPYLTGMAAKLLIVDFVSKDNASLPKDEIIEAYKSNDKEKMKNIFIVLKLDKERIEELNRK